MKRRELLKGILAAPAVSTIAAMPNIEPTIVFPEPIDYGNFGVQLISVFGARFKVIVHNDEFDWSDKSGIPQIVAKHHNFNDEWFETVENSCLRPEIVVPVNEKSIVVIVTEHGEKFKFTPQWTKNNKFETVVFYADTGIFK